MSTNLRRSMAACALLAAGLAGLFAADARALYRAGAAAQAAENYPLAVESYTAALAANPAYVEPMAGLAESFFLMEEYDEALRWVTEALRYDRESTALSILQARAQIGLGKPAEARRLLQPVLSRLPNDLEARLALAECDIAEGRAKSALAEYARTLRLAPESRTALLSMAILSESMGDSVTASKYYELALRSHPADPEVQLAAAAWEARRGRPAQAEAHARTALSLAPAMNRARVVLGGILLSRGEPGEAAATLREVVAVDRDNPVAWYTLGQAYRQAGDPTRAMASFASGITASPGDELCRLSQENTALDALKLDDPARRRAAAFHVEQGKLLEGRNALEQALAEYRRALILDPTWQDARVAYARVFLSLGFPAKYLSELRVIASLGSPGPRVSDEIEALSSELADSTSLAWGQDQYNLARTRYVVPVFTVASANRLLHPRADEDLARLFAAMLSRFDAVTVPESTRGVRGFEEAFRTARESGSDWFVILGLEESERSFAATADLFLSRTGARVASFPGFPHGQRQDTGFLPPYLLRPGSPASRPGHPDRPEGRPGTDRPRQLPGREARRHAPGRAQGRGAAVHHRHRPFVGACRRPGADQAGRGRRGGVRGDHLAQRPLRHSERRGPGALRPAGQSPSRQSRPRRAPPASWPGCGARSPAGPRRGRGGTPPHGVATGSC